MFKGLAIARFGRTLAKKLSEMMAIFPWRRVGFAVVALVLSWYFVGGNVQVEASVTQTITYRAAASANSGLSTVNSITVSKPTGTIEGDVMILMISTTGTPTYTIKDTGGNVITWTLIDTDATTTGVTGKISTYYRVATSTEVASYVVSWTGNQTAVAGVLSFSGVDTNNPVNAHSTRHSTGSGVQADEVNTTVANTMLVTSFTQYTSTLNTSFTPAASLTERWDTASSAATNNTSGSQDTEARAATGLTGTRGANTSQSAAWNAQMVALQPATQTFTESAYRWYLNINSIDFLGISYDPSGIAGCGSLQDRAQGVAYDSSNNVVYIAGFDGCNGDQWQIEKRSTLDGTLVTNFDFDGIVTYNSTCNGSSTLSDKAMAIVRDSSGNLYIGGYDQVFSGIVSACNRRWRIEKRDSTGALVTSFGTGGVVTMDPAGGSGEDDTLYALGIDNTNGRLYAAGSDSSPASSTQWRIAKYNASTGNLCSSTGNCSEGQFGGANGYVTADPNTTNPDWATSMSLDEPNGYLFIGGNMTSTSGGTSLAWHIEKRNAVTGNLCSSSGNCSAGAWNTTGDYSLNPSNQDDHIQSITYEPNGYVYAGGDDRTPGDNEWRMQKWNATTGNLCSSVANCSAGAFDTDGILTENLDNQRDDLINSFGVDSTNNYLFIIGSDGGKEFYNLEDYVWRVEKRKSTDGSLCINNTICNAQFGGTTHDGYTDPAGVATSNPIDNVTNNTNDHDEPLATFIDVSGDALFVVGYDKGASADGTGNTEWRLEKRNLLDGTRQFDMSTLAAQDTAALPSTSRANIRLRLDLHLTPALYTTDGAQPTFKLQFALKNNGTCDTNMSTTDETYADVASGSGAIQWLDNSTAADGDLPRSLGTDPVHSGHTNYIQSYEEANNFVTHANIYTTTDGLWDFALTDASAYGSYCFRVVYSSGSLLDNSTYGVVPEIKFCQDPPTDYVFRHGGFFCDQAKQRFQWSL